MRTLPVARARTHSSPHELRETVVVFALLVAMTAIVQWNLLRDGLPLSLDSSSQYWPWYTYLGDQLRSGQLPGWNPSGFGGAPFAADPLSGWTYVPAMLLFAVLPTDLAISAFMFGHMLLAGASMYALARVLDLRAPFALLAAGVYAYSGFFQFHTVAAQPYVGVAAWVPVALLGAELALRADRTGPRLRGWALSGLALSQSLAVWPGQGSYYCGMLFAAWTFSRVVRARPRSVALHVAIPLLLGVALDAAGVLPRLELQSLSNLAEGYPLTELVGGWRPADLVRLAVPGAWDVGLAGLGLSVVGLGSLARRPSAPFILAGVLWAGGLLLASSIETPLHTLLFHLLPGFARLHPHVSERILIVTYFAPALLAGLGLRVLVTQPMGRLLLPAIVVAVGVELLVAGRLGIDHQVGARWDALTRVDSYASAFGASPAAQFLQEEARSADSSFRYFGYGPLIDGHIVPYTQRFNDPGTRALLVNNRAISLGLQDMQGYNAVHLARFDAYLRVLNRGQAQNYHDAQVFASGIAAPLLDLLGVRYVVVGPDEPSGGYRVIYQDENTKILEHSTALPRVWLVHDARLASADEALALINSAAVDPRQTVLLERRAVEPNAIYMVFDEVTYPGWVAYVDGDPMQPVPADGLLQAVALPPGPHTVELRFESATLRAGLAISLTTLIGLVVLIAGTSGWSIEAKRSEHEARTGQQRRCPSE